MTRFNTTEALQLSEQARLVRLSDLLEKAPEIDDWFQRLATQYNEGFARWTQEKTEFFGRRSKSDLLVLGKRAALPVKSSTSKDELISQLLRAYWEPGEIFCAYTAARKANEDLQEWAENLRSLPKRLQKIVAEAEAFHVEWVKEASQSLYHAASAVRQRGDTIQEALWMSQEAHSGLKKIESGVPLADVVHYLYRAIEVVVMGLHGQNCSASGPGLQHLGFLSGARRMSNELRGIPSREAEKFITTHYSL